MQNPMTHDFSRIPSADVPRSQFDRSFSHKTTVQCGEIVPVYCSLAYPGDTFNLNVAAFGRLATPIKPVMDNMWMDFHFFAVPLRILWDNWKRFLGEQDNPTDSTDFLVPQVVAPVGGFLTGGLADYFGLPVGVAAISISALPFRAYNLIWKEFYRSEDLQVSPIIEKGDGPDNISGYPILRRTKAHDYLTSALPFAQKGADVPLPIGESAVVKTSASILFPGNNEPLAFRNTLNGNIPVSGRALNIESVEGNLVTGSSGVSTAASDGIYPANLFADLAEATASSINALREAFQLQRLLERDARGGTRIQELIHSHFGVLGDDARFQRPEFLGSARTNITMHPVPQTSPTGTYADTPQGNISSFATLNVVGGGFTKSFKEHCVVLGLASTRSALHYQQGVWPEWSYRTKYDFYWPALAHLGEKPVKNKEIFAQGTAVDEDTFGYQERWAEARYGQNIISGKLRSTETGGTPLDIWHYGQEFGNLPVLNSQFINEAPPMDRILATPTEPHVLLDLFFSVKAARPMPTYSVPGMIDHF